MTSERAPAQPETAPQETKVSAAASVTTARESRRPSRFETVVIAPEDQRGFQAFVATARAGLLPRTLVGARLRDESPVRISNIEPLPPIAIEPLPPITGLEFEELN